MEIKERSLSESPSKIRWICSILFSCMAAALVLCVPYAFVRVIDAGILGGNVDALWLWLVIGVSAQLLSSVLSYYGRVWAFEIGSQKAHEIRCETFERVERASLVSLHSSQWGELGGKISRLSESYREFYESILTTGTQFVVTFAGTFVVLLSLYWPLACCALAPVPVLACFFVWRKKYVNPASKQVFEAQNSFLNVLYSSMASLDCIQALGLETFFAERFQESSRTLLERRRHQVRLLGRQNPIMDAAYGVLLILVMGVGGTLALKGDMSVGVLVGFQLYAARVFASLRSAASVYQSWQHFRQGKKHSAFVSDIEERPPLGIRHCESGMRVSHLCFSWGSKRILNDISFSLEPGENLAILAPSGSGKTTLAYCLLGLYAPESGEIAYAWPLTSQNVGYVSQEPAVFSMSFRENIELLSGKLEDDEITTIIGCSGLNFVVEQLSGGLDTVVGSGGIRLSGGESKRLALARMLATHPRLLIIDQLTSDIEAPLCEKMFSAMREHFPKMSIIYLGHRQPEGLESEILRI